MIGVMWVLFGALVFALTSSRSETYSEAELVSLYFNTNFVVYFFIQVSAMLMLLATITTSEIYQWRVRASESLLSPVMKRLAKTERLRRMQVQMLQERVALLEEVRRFTISSYFSLSIASCAGNGEEDRDGLAGAK